MNSLCALSAASLYLPSLIVSAALMGLALGRLLPWRAWGWLAGSLALSMMCVIEVSSRRVVELARRPSARMSTLSSSTRIRLHQTSRSIRVIHCNYLITVWTSFVALFMTNNVMRSLSGLWTTTVQRDVLIVALGVRVVVVLTRTPLMNEEMTPRRLL